MRSAYHHKFTTEQEKLQMKKKWKANDYYMGAMLLGVEALLCAAGIENSTNGWAMLGWTCAALVMGSVGVVLAALGIVTEQQPDKNQEVHKAPTGTVTAGRSGGRRAG